MAKPEDTRPLDADIGAYIDSLRRDTKHTPADCQTPGHLVIRLPSRDLACGFGGVWPETGDAFVYDPKDHSNLSGKLVRINPPQNNWKA